jgi:hypothetical protein
VQRLEQAHQQRVAAGRGERGVEGVVAVLPVAPVAPRPGGGQRGQPLEVRARGPQRRGCGDGGLVPCPTRRRMRPSRASASKALRSVPRPTDRRVASSRSGGRRPPVGKSPLSIARRSCRSASSAVAIQPPSPDAPRCRGREPIARPICTHTADWFYIGFPLPDRPRRGLPPPIARSVRPRPEEPSP